MEKHNCKDCQIKSAAARNLSNEEFEVLENNSVQVKFKKGEIIFKEGALSLNVTYLKKGIAKLHRSGPAHDKILRLIKAPSYLGIPTTFGDKINQFSATAIEDTTVCFIDSNLFRNFIFSNGKFAFEIIAELCRNELLDYQRYTSQSQKQIPGLLAETLICFSDKLYESEQFNFPLNRGEIGDMIGTSRETVSRVLTEFANDGIIEMTAKDIKICNRERLNQISEKG
ncbi:MAG: Crp/Fnr family transcriptional regulator [Bacteroidota bacterium]